MCSPHLHAQVRGASHLVKITAILILFFVPLAGCTHLEVRGWGFKTAPGSLARIQAARNARATEPLIAALRDEDVAVRIWAAKALGELRDARALGPLSVALNDTSILVRIRATEALGELRDVRAVEPLIRALEDRRGFVRQYAAEALGELRDVRAVDRKSTRLNSSHSAKSRMPSSA